MRSKSNTIPSLLFLALVLTAPVRTLAGPSAARAVKNRRAKYEAQLQQMRQLYEQNCKPKGVVPPGPKPSPKGGGGAGPVPDSCEKLRAAIRSQRALLPQLEQRVKTVQQELANLQSQLKQARGINARLEKAGGDWNAASQQLTKEMARVVSVAERDALRQTAKALASFNPRSIILLEQQVGQLKQDLANAKAQRDQVAGGIARLKATLQRKIANGECDGDGGGPKIVIPPDRGKPEGPFTDPGDPYQYDCATLNAVLAKAEAEADTRRAEQQKLRGEIAEYNKEMALLLKLSRDPSLTAKGRAGFQQRWAVYKGRMAKRQQRLEIMGAQLNRINQSIARMRAALPRCKAAYANPDDGRVMVGAQIVIDVLKNDRKPLDPDLGIWVSHVSKPSLGTANIAPRTGKVIYHAGAKPGVDQFTYSIGYRDSTTGRVMPAPFPTKPGRITVRIHAPGEERRDPWWIDNGWVSLKRVTHIDGFNPLDQRDVAQITEDPDADDDAGGGDGTTFNGLFTGPTSAAWPNANPGVIRTIVLERVNGKFRINPLTGPDFDTAVFVNSKVDETTFEMWPGSSWTANSQIPSGGFRNGGVHTCLLQHNTELSKYTALLKVNDAGVSVENLMKVAR